MGIIHEIRSVRGNTPCRLEPETIEYSFLVDTNSLKVSTTANSQSPSIVVTAVTRGDIIVPVSVCLFTPVNRIACGPLVLANSVDTYVNRQTVTPNHSNDTNESSEWPSPHIDHLFYQLSTNDKSGMWTATVTNKSVVDAIFDIFVSYPDK